MNPKDAVLRGNLLPFEVPFARGDHAEDTEEYPLPFHPLSLGDSAILWMFGTTGESPLDDEITRSVEPKDPWDLPMHGFVAMTPPEAPRRSWWRRAFGGQPPGTPR